LIFDIKTNPGPCSSVPFELFCGYEILFSWSLRVLVANNIHLRPSAFIGGFKFDCGYALLQNVIFRRPFSLPGRITLGEQIARTVGKPTVTITTFVGDLRKLIADDTVPTAKDGPIRADFVKPSPDRRRLGILDNDLIISIIPSINQVLIIRR
jgi:hypothetical protein